MFGHVKKKHEDFVVKREDQMARSQTTKNRERLRKIIRGIIKKDPEIDKSDRT